MELWNLINPVYHATTPEEVQHYKVEPYVVCADVYGAPPHTGRGGWTWYTGSASWLYRVAMEAILGFQLRGSTLRFEPCIPPSWPGFEMSYRHRSATYQIRGGQLGWHRPRRAVDRAGRATAAERTQCRSATTDRPTTSAWSWADREQLTHGRHCPEPTTISIDCSPTESWACCSSPRFCTTCTKPTRTTGWSATRPTRTLRSASPPSAWRWRRFRSSSSAASSSEISPPRSPGRRLRYLLECPQGPEPDASGYKGFFYHFLDIETGRRVWQCELSTIDSAFLFAGALTVGTYFDRDTPDEVEIRDLADALYRRADWNWARDGGPTLTHGWRPENGFIPHRYEGYDEGLLLYILGLGSPTHPLPPESYRAYCATYQWKKIYDRELLYSGPLFTHQLSHMWIDFRGIRDEFMRDARQRLLREQPAGDVRAAGIRDPQSHEFRRLRRTLLGIHGMRRARLDKAGGRTASNASSSTISLEAPHSVPTTAPSPRGSSSPRCRLLLKSSSRPCGTLREWTWG